MNDIESSVFNTTIYSVIGSTALELNWMHKSLEAFIGVWRMYSRRKTNYLNKTLSQNKNPRALHFQHIYWKACILRCKHCAIHSPTGLNRYLSSPSSNTTPSRRLLLCFTSPHFSYWPQAIPFTWQFYEYQLRTLVKESRKLNKWNYTKRRNFPPKVPSLGSYGEVGRKFFHPLFHPSRRFLPPCSAVVILHENKK